MASAISSTGFGIGTTVVAIISFILLKFAMSRNLCGLVLSVGDRVWKYGKNSETE